MTLLINHCRPEEIKMPHPLLIFSQSDYLIQVVDKKSHTEWQTVQIQIHIELSDGDILQWWWGGNDRLFKMAAKSSTGTNTDEFAMGSLASSGLAEGDYASKHLRTPTRTASAQQSGVID